MKQKLLFALSILVTHLSIAQIYPDTFEFRGIHQNSTLALPTGVTAPGPTPAGLNTLVVPSSTGRLACPVLVDMDGDGDMDMVTGSQSSLGKLYYFENTGTSTAPNWVATALPTLDAVGYAPGGNNETKCDFVDMDNDGDFDLLLGSKVNATGANTDDLHYYENTGTATVPNFVAATIPGIANQNMANFPSIGLVDIDNDEDFDLVCVSNDSVSYMQNTGTKFAPVFERKYNLENPWDLDAGTGSFQRNWPHGDVLITTTTLVDIGNDGDLDMCLGRDDGTFRWIENIGNAAAPDYDDFAYQSFPGDLATFDMGQFATITMGDVNGDGVMDAVVGGFNPGHFAWFEGVLTAPLSIDEENLAIHIQVSPNPVKDILTVQFNSNQINKTNITMYSITGQMVYNSNAHIKNGRAKMDVSKLQSGLYFLKIKSDIGQTIVKKITIN
ncbi:MAG: T9SS type A sorting domain-containing protein [Kordia sp.]|uniref:T9SS type A sorting domain-containing protein n=1 Tax=Kordia sp. TaxID=1965332 RepID=UPI00385C8829